MHSFIALRRNCSLLAVAVAVCAGCPGAEAVHNHFLTMRQLRNLAPAGPGESAKPRHAFRRKPPASAARQELPATTAPAQAQPIAAVEQASYTRRLQSGFASLKTAAAAALGVEQKTIAALEKTAEEKLGHLGARLGTLGAPPGGAVPAGMGADVASTPQWYDDEYLAYSMRP